MFKFDFKVEEDPENVNHFSEKNIVDEVEAENDGNNQCAPAVEWHESQGIPIRAELLENLDIYKLQAEEITAGDTTIAYTITGYVLKDVIAAKSNKQSSDLNKAEENHTDLIPGTYEGGFKVWECTNDLLEYLAKNYKTTSWKQKRVLDLGCGAGLLGIYAHKCGAIVHFQDYNAEVLERLTIPNLFLNVADDKLDLESLNKTAQFYSGDWAKYAELTRDEAKFDIILTSETIYNPDNHLKLLDTFYTKLKPSGIVLVAAKTYYFGVGGGLRQFEEVILKDKRFESIVLWTSTEGISREIIELKLRNL